MILFIMPRQVQKRYPTELEEPMPERLKIRIGDTTISAEFTGMRVSPSGGFVSHYNLVIKRKGGIYQYGFTLWDHFGKARVYVEAMIDSFHRFLRRVKYVNHSSCPVCRRLKLSAGAIELLTEHISYGEYTVL